MVEPRTQAADTSRDAERILFEHYRRLGPSERLQLVFDLQATSDGLSLWGIRNRHPEADEREQRLRLAALKIGRELMIRAFGWDPRERGY